MILVYIPCKDEEEAKKLGKTLLKKKLIACANIHPIKSMYVWKSSLVEDTEAVLLCKTIDKKYKEIERTVMKEHSYECPCVMRIPVKANKEYEKWVWTGVRIHSLTKG